MNKVDIDICPSQIEWLKGFLKNVFPTMKQSIINKNVDFTIMLEDYTWELYWIEAFLEDKNYKLEWIKYSKTKSWDFPLTNEQKEKISNWKYYIWLKIFYKKIWNNLVWKIYFVIAKKKNRISIDWVGEKVRELIPKNKSNA